MRAGAAVALALALGLACANPAEVPPPAPAPAPEVVAPAPEPRGDARERKAGRRRAPGRGKAPRGQAPPDPFVAKDLCPGECCSYGPVTAAKDAPMLAAPGGREIGRVPQGEPLDARTGEVHATPVPAEVKHPHTLASEEGDERVKPGDRIWVLMPTAEGWGLVWHDGGVFDAEILFVDERLCDRPDASAQSCWAELARPLPDTRWWVEVETGDGQVGWIDNSDRALDGLYDGC